MSKPELGRLEKIKLRSCWESEPRDLTPWLAEEAKIVLLGEALGIEMEVQGTEASVGSFGAGIVCHNTADNSAVPSENQLKRADHTNLGQNLPYAAGFDAVTAVRITSRFTEEHRVSSGWETKFDFRWLDGPITSAALLEDALKQKRKSQSLLSAKQRNLISYTSSDYFSLPCDGQGLSKDDTKSYTPTALHQVGDK